MFCGNCGEKMDKNTKFCPKCGKAIKKVGANKKHTGIYILILLALIGSVGVGLWQLRDKKGNMNSSELIVANEKENKEYAEELKEEEELDYEYLAVVRNDEGKYGYINEKGEEVIPCQFDVANSFGGKKLAIVGIENGENKEGETLYKYGFINYKGEIQIPIQYDLVSDYSFQAETCEAITVGIESGKDTNGNIQYQFININEYGDTIYKFEQGVYPAGYLAWDSERYLPIIWENNSANIFVRHGVSENGKEVTEYAMIGLHGEEICMFGKYMYDVNACFPLSSVSSDNNIFVVYQKEGISEKREEICKYGVVNRQGDIIIPIEYEQIQIWSNYIIAQKYLGIDESGEEIYKYGLFDANGSVILPFEYYDINYLISETNDGQIFIPAALGKDAYGVVDFDGNVVIPFEYDYAECNVGMFQMEKNMEHAIFNQYGIRITDFSDNIHISTTKYVENWGYIGICHTVLPLKYGMIAEDGKVILPFEYDLLTTSNTSYIRAEKDGKCGYFDHEGNVIIPLEYEYCDYLVAENGWRAVGYSNGIWDEETDTYDCCYIDENNEVQLELDDKYIYAGVFISVK